MTDPMGATGVRFRVWGCRGSIPTPGPQSQVFGGDTSCYEVIAPDGRALVVDCGSGLRRLGDAIMADGRSGRLEVLLSHTHIDHLIGLGYFVPLIVGRVDMRLWSADPPGQVQDALCRLFAPPLWPLRIPGDVKLPIVSLPDEGTEIAGMRVDPFALNHPGGCTGFRIAIGGRVIVTVTDHEHGDPVIDAGVRRMVEDADLMIYDAPFSEAFYPQKRGWGHSNWEEGLRLATAARVRHTLIVHHAPPACDRDLAAAEVGLRDASAPSFAFARDGMEVIL